MSNYHILTQDIDKKHIRVVFHIPVPATGTNENDIQWRDAVVLDAGGSDNIESIVGNIDGAELTALKSGALIEYSETLRFSSVNITNAQRKEEIEARYSALSAVSGDDSILAKEQIELEWIGYSGDVTP